MSYVSVEISLEELAVGLACALRARGFEGLPLTGESDRAFMAAAQDFVRVAEDSGYWCSFRLIRHFSPAFGGGGVREVWTAPLAALLLRRRDALPDRMEFSASVAGAEALFTALPGRREWYDELATSYLSHLDV